MKKDPVISNFQKRTVRSFVVGPKYPNPSINPTPEK
jgi:hypothetical protein